MQFLSQVEEGHAGTREKYKEKRFLNPWVTCLIKLSFIN